MKKIANLLSIILTIVACSCKGNEEPSEIFMRVDTAYLPVSMMIDKSDTELVNKYKDWDYKTLVVNSKDEFPEDPFGFNEAYNNTSFKSTTIVLAYRYIPYKTEIVSFQNRFTRLPADLTYLWFISSGLIEVDRGTSDTPKALFVRYAIEVPKLRDDHKVDVQWSLHIYDDGSIWQQ